MVAYAPQAHGPETLFICVVETAPSFPTLGLKLLLILQSAMLVVLAWLCRSTD